MAEAVELLLPGSPELKWPNDILWKGKKLAGILVETAVDRERVQHVALGIGLNVNQQQFPDELANRATSLSLITGQPHHRAEVLAAVLSRLELWIDHLEQDGAPPVIAAWQRYAPWIGSKISVRDGNRELFGKALGLEPHGALRLQDDQGQEHSIVSGDVYIRQ